LQKTKEQLIQMEIFNYCLNYWKKDCRETIYVLS
jgi:hypothetical protein